MSEFERGLQPERPTGWRAVARRLWQTPARARDRRQTERRVEFLELFFDLVFVVLIAQLAHRLAEHPSWSGFGWFAFLFFAVWSSWLNGTSYHDNHGTHDVSIRVFTFAQMLTVAFMAVFAGDVPGDGATGFAIAYSASSALLTIMWFRTGYHDHEHRRVSYPYSTAYAASTVLFAGSVFVTAPAMYWVWFVALVIEAGAVVPAKRNWRIDIDGILATPTFIERLGLLVIIVLGEVIAGAVNGIAHHEPVDAQAITVGFLGVLIAIALWWLYFDLISHRRPRPHLEFTWMYLHFPLVLGIAAAGAGILAVIERGGDAHLSSGRWLLVGSVALALATNTILTRTLEARKQLPRLYRAAAISSWVSVVLILLLGAIPLELKATLVALNVLLLTPIALGITVWLRTDDLPRTTPT